MGMSTYAYAIVAPEDPEAYAGKCAALQACLDAMVEVPEELLNEDGEPLDPMGHKVWLNVEERSDDMRLHYEVRLADLPEGTIAVRFTNSW